MTGLGFQISSEYASQLRHVESKDLRTDADILHSLTHHTSVTSEKNIWTYWHSGISSMPSWCQRNIINWVRLHGSSWTVRVLDTVPDSPNHALAWIDPAKLPKAFVDGTMIGPYVGPHSADFLRCAALYAYGGVWMDVGNMLFRDLDRVAGTSSQTRLRRTLSVFRGCSSRTSQIPSWPVDEETRSSSAGAYPLPTSDLLFVGRGTVTDDIASTTSSSTSGKTAQTSQA